jgi:hypothetical protein
MVEIQALMPPPHIKLLSLEEVGLHEGNSETTTTIAENAVLKTDYVRQRLTFRFLQTTQVL